MRETVREELIRLATENAGVPLVILDHVVDKRDATEVYGALVWIESQLSALLQNQLR